MIFWVCIHVPYCSHYRLVNQVLMLKVMSAMDVTLRWILMSALEPKGQV